jgi:hypothetical protein
MPSLKAIANLARKAAPKLREAVEVAKDLIGEVKTEGAVYKQTGHSLTQARRLFETDAKVKHQGVEGAINAINSISRETPSVNPTFFHVIQDTAAMKFSNPGMERFSTRYRQAIKDLPKHSRPRQLFATKLKADRTAESKFNDLSSLVSHISSSHVPRLRRQTDVPQGWSQVEEGAAEAREAATNSGFEEYIMKKYNRKPTKVD